MRILNTFSIAFISGLMTGHWPVPKQYRKSLWSSAGYIDWSVVMWKIQSSLYKQLIHRSSLIIFRFMKTNWECYERLTAETILSPIHYVIIIILSAKTIILYSFRRFWQWYANTLRPLKFLVYIYLIIPKWHMLFSPV